MNYTDIKSLENGEILEQLKETGQFICRFPFTSRETDIFLSRVLRITLEQINQEHLHSHLEYVFNELSVNSSKANSKRLYFMNLGLEINNSDQYEKGMSSFKKDVFEDFSKFEHHHLDKNSYIEILLDIRNDNLEIEIQNQSPLHQKERERITERLEIARKFENLTEVLTYGFDETEGAGFGLIIILLMLRKVNLDEKALSFKNEDDKCITSLKIPLNLLSSGHSEVIASVIVEELKQMPQFPQNILNLQRELSDPNCSFNSIADTVKEDAALAAEILRISNSPVYRLRNEITDVVSAIRVIGMLGVKSVLYNFGVSKIFRNRYDEKLISELQNHSFHVALIGSFIAGKKNAGRISEDIYVAALLHDMGKIIVSSMNRELEQKLEKVCREKHIPVAVLDDLTDGYNHSLIGAKVAENWNFPGKYIEAIRYHHIPLEAAEEYRAVTYAVYLGNEIYHYERGERDFNDLNYMVLSFFGLEQIDSFHNLLEELKMEGFGL